MKRNLLCYFLCHEQGGPLTEGILLRPFWEGTDEELQDLLISLTGIYDDYRYNRSQYKVIDMTRLYHLSKLGEAPEEDMCIVNKVKRDFNITLGMTTYRSLTSVVTI